MLSGLEPNVGTLTAVRPNVSVTEAETGLMVLEIERVLPLRSEMLVGIVGLLLG